MTITQASQLCDQLRTQFSKKDFKSALSTLQTLKLLLAKLNLLYPASTVANELLLTREVLETACLLSIRLEDLASFERYFTQLKTFYSYCKPLIQDSPRMYMLYGLELMRLLAYGKLCEFHVQLEQITDKNVYIDYTIMIEQSLIEGSYNKIWNLNTNVPAEEYKFFMNILSKTIRNEIAKSSETAYEELVVEDAMILLYFKERKEFLEFCEQVGWKIDGGRVVFKKGEEVKEKIDTDGIIKHVLGYAKELETIV